MELTWVNTDEYEFIEVRRKADSRYVYQTIAKLDGSENTYTDAGMESGTWTYQIRARGVNQMADSDVSDSYVSGEVVLP